MTCPCGRDHVAETEDILIGPGALASLAGLVAKNNPTGKIFLVSDENCFAAAGEKVLSALGDLGPETRVVELILGGGAEGLLPDERGLGRIFAECPPDAGLILAVGSGTVNDLARFAASRLKIPYVVAATAPSMDGYASSVSALLIDGFKSTYAAAAPAAIVGDTDILGRAPGIMKSAGFGDMIGKYTSVSDWRLGSLVFGEYHCRYIESLVERAVEKCAANPSDAAALMEGLCLSGTAMSYAGSSRPASGAEHHLSHFWEMAFLSAYGRAEGSVRGQSPDTAPEPLHGIKVGVATLVMLRLRELLLEDAGGSAGAALFERAREKARSFDFAAYESKIAGIYGRNARKILAEEALEREPGNVLRRLDIYREKWDGILAECARTPNPGCVKELLRSAGAPVSPGELGVTRRQFVDGIVYSKEIRRRFTVLRLLADLGTLEEYAGALAGEFGY